MAHRFVREGDLLVGELEDVELEVVVELLRQTRQVVAPPPVPDPAASLGDDPFAQMMAECGLGDLAGAGVADDASALLDRDPALDRIVPPAHKEDEAVAAEYRRFTERSIRERKAVQMSRAEEVLARLREGGSRWTRRRRRPSRWH